MASGSLNNSPTMVLAAVLVSLLAVGHCQPDMENNNYGFVYNQDGEDIYRHSGQFLQDWAKMSGRVVQSKCVPIPENLTLCNNIGYDTMLLPNLLEQDSLEEVTQQASSWIPLVRIECHPDTRVFLCSLFSPVCLERLIYPCRALCQDVHNACIGRMKRYRFDWPEMLQCDQFPVDNDMCIKLMHEVKPDNNCTACKHPLNYESLIDHFCRSEIVMKVTVKSFRDDIEGNRQLILRKKRKFYKTENISKGEARRLTPVIEEGASCTCNTINATQERYLLMGRRLGDKLIIQFGMVWKKKDKEFRKGLRAIRKSSKCEGIFRELSATGVDGEGVVVARNETIKVEGKRGGKRKRGNKKRKGGKKGKKGRRRKGRKGGRKNRKDRKDRKGRKDRKDRKDRKRKGNRKGKKGKSSKQMIGPDQSMVSKWKAEDLALNNFLKLDN